jgi:hypothetical protein
VAKEFRLCSFSFDKWHQRHQALRMAEYELTSETHRKVKSHFFTLWLTKYLRIQKLIAQHQDLVSKVGNHKCRLALSGWMRYVTAKRQKKQLIKLGQFKLLKKIISNSFIAIRYYSFYRK